ncbi:DoxX family protein [Acaryochloris marina]|uniref:DoxX family protein n=1 Tax=Acaryochloris marina TaxID=155978 RepID=UPI0021C49F02|nr:DoxX family protein [Acaryochloris marina]BDM83347.1 hypothetical protein AM10699_62080 [Acaryochloris marina MBIC10699]
MTNYPRNFKLNRTDVAISYVLLRLLIGVNFLNHGLTRIGNIPGFVESMVKAMENSYFPEPLVRINAFLVPVIELIVGVLIILGWQTRIALTITSGLMVILMLGVTSVQNWQTAGDQLVYGVILFILLACRNFNTVSVDYWLKRKTTPSERSR